MKDSVEEQPYDDRHSTPPKQFRAARWGNHVEPGEASYDYLRNRPDVFSPKMRSHIRAVLDELERLRGAEVPDHNRSWNLSVEQAECFIRERAMSAQVATKLGAAHAVLLEELERLRIEAGALQRQSDRLRNEIEISVNERRETPGLTYADPEGRFTCHPNAESRNPEDLSVLELRVLSAHLATALDNVTAALKSKGDGA